MAATITGSRILYLEARRQGERRPATHRASEDIEVAPTTSSDSNSDGERNEERRREELDRQSEEEPAPHLARDDSSFSSSDDVSGSDSVDERIMDEATESSDDGSVIYWASRGSTVGDAGMQ